MVNEGTQDSPCGNRRCTRTIDADRAARGVKYCDKTCKKRADTQRAHDRRDARNARLTKERDDAIAYARAAKKKITELEARINSLESELEERINDTEQLHGTDERIPF
jgi:chromosome segregation ATPase